MNISAKESSKTGDCRLLVGTSGFSYTEWVDAGFYPPGTKTGGMLPLYARCFAITELNYTWYQMPPSFARTPSNRKYLAVLIDRLYGLSLAVEFRHRSWADDRVFSELERRRVTLVAIDAPNLPGLFPALDVVTNPDLFYVRFHGRNAKGWRSGNMQLQFDYSYSDDELRQWVETKIEPMSTRARRGVLFFNNHVRAQAPENAQRMTRLLKEHGLLRCANDPSFI